MRRIICALALFAAAPAAAQEEDAPRPAPGALAAELIAQSSANGVFEALPADQIMVVRHRRSGLVCRLDPARANRLLLFPESPRGDDVACDSEGGGEAVRLYATRFPFQTTVEQQLRGAVSVVERLHPDLRAYAPTIAATADAAPSHATAQFYFNAEDGARLYSRVSVAMIGDWVIKLRFTALAPDAAAARRAEMTSAMLWTTTLSELTARRA